jgi:hypothetical protein
MAYRIDSEIMKYLSLQIHLLSCRAHVRKVHGADCIIINPLDLNNDVNDWKTCMYNYFEVIEKCDEAFFMPNWHQSAGANIEAHWSKALGVKLNFVTKKQLR